jgi:hypothetical protein
MSKKKKQKQHKNATSSYLLPKNLKSSARKRTPTRKERGKNTWVEREGEKKKRKKEHRKSIVQPASLPLQNVHISQMSKVIQWRKGGRGGRDRMRMGRKKTKKTKTKN